MEIAFVDWTGDLQRPGIGGMSDIVWGLAEHLANSGENVHVVAPSAPDVHLPCKGVAMHRFHVPPIGYRNIVGHSLIVLTAWRALRQIPHLDLIHAPEYLATGLTGG